MRSPSVACDRAKPAAARIPPDVGALHLPMHGPEVAEPYFCEAISIAEWTLGPVADLAGRNPPFLPNIASPPRWCAAT